MYTAGKIYWAYLAKKKTQVLVLEPCSKRGSDSYKFVKLTQVINGLTREYQIDFAALYTIDSNAFVSYIDDLSSYMFMYIYREFYKKRAPKRKTMKLQSAQSWNYQYGKSNGGYANPNWLPPGTRRIKVYRG